MKKYFYVIATLLCLQFTNQTFACSCMPVADHFCGTLQNDTSIASVVLAQKLQDVYYGMKVRVLQLISGELIDDTVTVWGDNGALCRLYTGGWANGDTIILALHHTDLTGNIIYNNAYPPDLEMAQDYHISGCGPYTLNVNNGIVSGFINAATLQYMTYAQFLAEPCIQTLGEENPENSQSIVIYPNPAIDQIGFLIKDGENALWNINIVNTLGQMVYSKTNVSLNLPLNIDWIHPGMYHVVIWNEKTRTSIHLVKN